MKIEVNYDGIPYVALIPEDRRDIQILHRLAEHGNMQITYAGIPGAAFAMSPLMTRAEDHLGNMRNRSTSNEAV